jgi:hypothetical protein
MMQVVMACCLLLLRALAWSGGAAAKCPPVATDKIIHDKTCCAPLQAHAADIAKCWSTTPTTCAMCVPPTSVGCFSEKPHDIGQAGRRTLAVSLMMDGYGPIIDSQSVNSAVLTYQLCAKACGDAGNWAYMAVGGNGYPKGPQHAGSQCWCGNEINPHAKKLDDEECMQSCSGDAGQKPCGGDWKVSVFEIKCGTGGCGDGAIHPGWGGGWTFVASVTILASVYVVGGAAVGNSRRGSAQRQHGAPHRANGNMLSVLRRHPHWPQLIALEGLCADGLQFLLRRQRSSYPRERLIQDEATQPLSPPPQVHTQKRSKRVATRPSPKGQPKRHANKPIDSQCDGAASCGAAAASPVWASAGYDQNVSTLQEQRDSSVHSSQATIKVIL